ncbi:hypothetical protein FGG08_007182 [Glutinoglossum americanum]|uniref:Uncharacterized protein n=1 Tax=Glutinoglossum americanum TaxID=1670608 RepID=A0A9P8L0B0_9PEZI|nr:hypothetical protein FGG08_007182 [Glutinoglossum americanum]
MSYTSSAILRTTSSPLSLRASGRPSKTIPRVSRANSRRTSWRVCRWRRRVLDGKALKEGEVRFAGQTAIGNIPSSSPEVVPAPKDAGVARWVSKPKAIQDRKPGGQKSGLRTYTSGANLAVDVSDAVASGGESFVGLDGYDLEEVSTADVEVLGSSSKMGKQLCLIDAPLELSDTLEEALPYGRSEVRTLEAGSELVK